MKAPVVVLALLGGCALDPGATSIFGTKYDKFVDKMYACAQQNKCEPFQLDTVLFDAPKGITVVPTVQQARFNGALGYVHLASSTITIKVQPSASSMVGTLEHELGHLRGKRHANDTTGPVRDERAEALERALRR